MIAHLAAAFGEGFATTLGVWAGIFTAAGLCILATKLFTRRRSR